MPRNGAQWSDCREVQERFDRPLDRRDLNGSLMGSELPEGLRRVDRCRIVLLPFHAVAL
jgi:hypothetical protein